MVGQQVAVFSAVEVKGPKGRATAGQIHFINQLIKAGGFGVIAKNANDAKKGLGMSGK
jgi:hypothetical protein